MSKKRTLQAIVVLVSILTLTIKMNSQKKINFIEAGAGAIQKTGVFTSDDMNIRMAVDFSYLRQFQLNQPLFWGVNSYYFTMGSRTATLEEPFDLGFEDFFYSTTSHVWGNHVFLRFYPDIYLGKTELYLEAHLGFKYLFTVTSRSIDGGSDVSEYLSENHSISISYGASGGIQYPLSDMHYLKASVGYFPGISASYYTENKDLSVTTATIEGFEFRRSPTDIFRYSLGITFRF